MLQGPDFFVWPDCIGVHSRQMNVNGDLESVRIIGRQVGMEKGINLVSTYILYYMNYLLSKR